MLPISATALFLIVFLCIMPPSVHTQTQPHRPKVRVHFMAAEEVDWDYAPFARDEAMGGPFDNFEKALMGPGTGRAGRVYRKCIYREYEDAKFNRPTLRSPEEQYLGIVGPVLYGEVGDNIKVVFKCLTGQ